MIRTAILAAVLLGGCATTNPQPAPVIYEACTALTMQPVTPQPVTPQPRLPDGATVPQPMTDDDAAGLALFLDHVAVVAAWGREGWSRVEAQQRACS